MPAKPLNPAAPGQKPSSKSRKGCPICGKPASEGSRPFCSERCRDVDLNRWLSDAYSIPAREGQDDDAD
jgi:endogenous inhibitor of DNA gyrase (YacG/DUF329 family)